MSFLKKAVKGQWISGVTRITAAEMDALARMLELLAQPSLVSLATPINTGLCAPTISGTQVQLGAIGANDRVITAGAACPAYHRDYVDFATSGDDGGPLAAGDYTIYFDVYEPDDPGTPTPVPYQCYPIAVPTSDPDAPALAGPIYLVPATVHWDGASTLSALVDQRAGNWGPLRLDRLGAGNSDRVLIGSGRLVEFEGDVQADGELTAGAVDASAQVGGSSGPYGMINIGSLAHGGGMLVLSCDAAGAKPSGIVAGKTVHVEELVADSDIQIDDGAVIKFANNEPPATAGANQLYGCAVAKAWVLFADAGGYDVPLIQKSFNVASVTRVQDGEYLVVFQVPFGNDNVCAVASLGESTNGNSTITATVLTNGTECHICAYDAGVRARHFVSLVVFGGNQS